MKSLKTPQNSYIPQLHGQSVEQGQLDDQQIWYWHVPV